VSENVTDEIAMAVNAVVFKDTQAYGPQTDRLGEVLEREALGVPEAVLGLHKILGNERMRDMTVRARRDGVVAGVLPAVVLFPHDVTIDARFRVRTEVRKALGIADGEGPRAQHDAN
jgi:hypothetical protein